MLMTPVNGGDATVAAVPSRAFLSTLVWIKADGAATAGTQSLIEILAPAGWETPWHVHHTHDEYFYVLEGTIAAMVGDARVVLGPGDFAFGPRGVPHGYRVQGSAPARLLMITGDRDFAEFVRELSEPAPGDTLPPPSEPDVEKIVAAAARHGIELLGPWPDAASER
jgi:mannose-6-phosphate isomerase-like protein (cupin superfamily)